MKGTSVTAITWSLCSAAYAPLLAVDLLCGNLRRQPFTFLLVQKNISLPCCVCLKTLPYTLQGENGYFHQAVDEYGVCQGASSFWRSLSHSLTHPIYIYTPILLEFSSPLFLYFSPGYSWTYSIVVGPPPPPPVLFPSLSSCLPQCSAVVMSWRWPLGRARGCNTGHGSCLCPPLVSCVAASGAACLPLLCCPTSGFHGWKVTE